MREDAYERYRGYLYKFAVGKMGVPRQDADDLVQTAMLRAWKSGVSVAPANERAYLITTLRRSWIDTIRAKGYRVRTVSMEDLLSEFGSDGPDPEGSTLFGREDHGFAAVECGIALDDAALRIGMTAAKSKVLERRLIGGTVRQHGHTDRMRLYRLCVKLRAVYAS